jgi:hypothetical protein
MYCIYTDREVETASGNWDHIIPLSLGGLNQFCVWADKTFNSKMGEKIDGAIANDALIVFARREADARGHSGSEPIPKWRDSKFEGRPVQVTFGKEGMRIWDARSKTYVDEEYFAGKEIRSNFSMDRFASIRFVAKVALGGGYSVYGELIRSAVDCEELRRLASLDIEAARKDPNYFSSKLSVCDRFHPDVHNSPEAAMYKALCEFTQRSTFICVPHQDSISFHVGVVGVYLGSVVCPANTSELPNDGLHDVGHAVLLSPGSIEKISLRELAGRLYEMRTGEPPPTPPPHEGEAIK